MIKRFILQFFYAFNSLMNMHKSSLKFLFNFCLKRSIFTRNDYSVEIACRDELLTTSSGIAALFLLKQKQYFILLFLWASLRSKAHQDDFNTMIFRLLSVRRIRKEKITLKLQFIREADTYICVIIVHSSTHSPQSAMTTRLDSLSPFQHMHLFF